MASRFDHEDGPGNHLLSERNRELVPAGFAGLAAAIISGVQFFPALLVGAMAAGAFALAQRFQR